MLALAIQIQRPCRCNEKYLWKQMLLGPRGMGLLRKGITWVGLIRK